MSHTAEHRARVFVVANLGAEGIGSKIKDVDRSRFWRYRLVTIIDLAALHKRCVSAWRALKQEAARDAPMRHEEPQGTTAGMS
jgi:hypothetical protein